MNENFRIPRCMCVVSHPPAPRLSDIIGKEQVEAAAASDLLIRHVRGKRKLPVEDIAQTIQVRAVFCITIILACHSSGLQSRT